MSTLFDHCSSEPSITHASVLPRTAVRRSAKSDPSNSERRTDKRYKSAYIPCLLKTAVTNSISIIRNLSYGGANVKTSLSLQVGDRVTYAWGAQKPINARVAWVDGDLCGLENIDHRNALVLKYPYRAVRVNGLANVQICNGSMTANAFVQNISLGGICANGLNPWWADRLVTVRICGFELPNATVRWSSGFQSGIVFSKRLRREELQAIIQHKDFSLLMDA